MVHLPAQSANYMGARSSSQHCRGLDAPIEHIPWDGPVQGSMLAEDLVICHPSSAPMPLRLAHNQASICQPVTGVLVWGQDCHIC